MQPFTIDEDKVYPATHHFRIIIHSGSPAQKEIAQILNAFSVARPLCKGNASKGGRYETLNVAINLTSRAEHIRLDESLRAVAGVKILL